MANREFLTKEKTVSWELTDVFLGLLLLLPLTVVIIVSTTRLLRLLTFFWPFLKGFTVAIAFGLASFFSGVILVFWLAVYRHKASWSELGLKKGRFWQDFLYAGVAETVVLITLGFYAWLLLKLFGLNLPVQPVVKIFGPSVKGFITAFIAVAVLAPFSEELFFRGFVYAGLKARWGQLKAQIVSAAIFAFFHFQLLLFVPLFVIGLILALLYETRKSLWASYLMHAFNNAIALLVVYFAAK